MRSPRTRHAAFAITLLACTALPMACDEEQETGPEFEQLVKSQQQSRIELKVRTNGNDTTGDGVGVPFRTVRAALDSIPADATDTSYVIDCTGITEEVGPDPSRLIEPLANGLDLPMTASNAPAVRLPLGPLTTAYPLPFGYEGALTIQAEPTTLETIVAYDKLDKKHRMLGVWRLPQDVIEISKYDNVSSLQTFYVTAGGTRIATDEFKGKLLIGANRGQIAVITGNTESCAECDLEDPECTCSRPCIPEDPQCSKGVAELETTLGQSSAFTAPFKIATQSCELRNSGTNGTTVAARGLLGSLVVNGIKISHANHLFPALTLHPLAQARFQGADIDGMSVLAGVPLFEACRFQGGMAIPDWPSGHSYRPIHHANGGYNLVRSFVQDIEFGGAQGTGSVSLGTTVVDGCSFLGENAISGYDGQWHLKEVLVRNAPHHGFYAAGGSPNSIRSTRFVGNLGDAIHADGPGDTFVGSVRGDDNGGFGISASNGAQVEVTMFTRVTGDQGDLRVGTLPTRSLADFRSEIPQYNEIDLTPGVGDASRVYQYETCCGVYSQFSSGDSHEFASAHAARLDTQGNLVFVGRSASSSLSFPGGAAMPSLGGYDGFVVKQTSSGEHLWSKRLGGASHDMAYAVTTDAADGIVVVGSYTGAVSLGGSVLPVAGGYESYAVKLGPDGDHEWSVGLASTGSDAGNDVAVDRYGDVFVVGATDWNPYSAGAGDVTLHKISGSGLLLWSKSFPSTAGDAGFGITTDAAGDVLMVGSFGNSTGGTIDFDSGVAGPSLTSTGVRAGFVAKLSGASGAHIWSKAITDSNHSDLNAVATDDQGRVFVGGASRGYARIAGGPPVLVSGEYDFFLAALHGADGSHVWSRAFGAAGYEIAYDLAIDGSGGLVATGQTASASPAANFGGGPIGYTTTADVVVARYDRATGTHLASMGVGDGGDDVSFGVAVRPETGNVYLAGHASGALNLWNGGGQSDSPGGYGFWVANVGRLEPGTCSDGILDGSETDVDCGGSCMDRCGVDFACSADTDCAEGVCSGDVCQAPSCFDLAQNGDETDVDCGGQCPGTCDLWSSRSTGGAHEFIGYFGGTHRGSGNLIAWSDGGVVVAGSTNSTNVDLGTGVMAGTDNSSVVVARYSGTGIPVWTKRLGGQVGTDAMVFAAAGDPLTDRIAVVGMVAGPANFGAGAVPSTGAYSGFVVVLDQDGVVQWSRAMGSASHDAFLGVAFDATGDVVAVGSTASSGVYYEYTAPNFTGDARVVRFDGTTGATVWQKTFGSTVGSTPYGDMTTGVSFDPSGDLFISGTYAQSNLPPPGVAATLALDGMTLVSSGIDGFVSKLSGSTGNAIWLKNITNGAYGAGGHAVVSMPDGDVLLAAVMQGAVTVSNGPPVANIGDFDMVLARLNGADGAHEWSVSRGGAGNDLPAQLTLDGLGRGVLSGDVSSVVNFGNGNLPFAGNKDACLLVFSPVDGSTIDANTYGGSGSEYATGAAVGVGTGKLFIAGHGTAPFDMGDGVKGKASGLRLFWGSVGATP